MADMLTNIDHDLLIELRTEMRGVRNDIQKLSDNTAIRLTAVESEIKTIREQEIPGIKQKIAYWAGGIGVISALVAATITWLSQHKFYTARSGVIIKEIA